MTSPDDPLGRKDLERLIVPSKELEEAISNRRAYEAMLGGIRDWVQDRQHALDLMEPALEQFRRMEATRQLIEPPAHLQVMAEQNQLLREIERQNEERQRLLDSITQPPIFDAQATLQPFSGVEQYIKSSLFELLERTSTLSPDAVSFRELGTQFQRYRDVIDLYLGEVKSPDSDVIWRTITDSVTEALVTQPESVKEPEAGPDAAVQYAVGSFRGTVTQLPDEWRTPSTLLNIATLIVSVLSLILAIMAFNQDAEGPTAAHLTELRDSFVARQRWLSELAESLLVEERQSVAEQQRTNQILERIEGKGKAKHSK